MKRIAILAVLAAVPFLLAAVGLDEQPSYKTYEVPVLAPPTGAVPVSGREVVSQQAEPTNPIPSSEASVAKGRSLFAINCAMCHGGTPAELGRVGQRFKPPPPHLAPALVQSLSDAFIFKAITFGFGRMPSFQQMLSPQERWNLVNFLRTRK